MEQCYGLTNTVQNYVVLDIVLDTGNAAGQNMVTLAAQVACELIRKETGHNYFLESNINSDKKPSVRNMLLGPGHAVAAETVIKNSVMKKVLKMDPDVLFKSWPYYSTISSMAGIHGMEFTNQMPSRPFIWQRDRMQLVQQKIALPTFQ